MNSKQTLSTISEIIVSEMKYNISEREALKRIREALRNWEVKNDKV